MIQVEELYKLFLKCQAVTTDSRNVPEGSMFFALKGETFDGNDYAMKALEAGAKYAIVDRPTLDGASVKGKRCCIAVENALTMLQQLACHHRKMFDIPVIGITGTNGKTTTKELVSAVLSRKYNVVSTSGNLNNHIGVPLTLLRINERTGAAVVEMGASSPGEILSLSMIAQPSFGIVTNVGKAHLEGFGSFEGVRKTKGELYDYLRQKGGTVFYNADNRYLQEMVSSRNGLVTSRYGLAYSGAEILDINVQEPYLRIRLQDGTLLKTNLVGKYNADNVMAALCVGDAFKVPLKEAVAAIAAYKPSNNRSQMTVTERNTVIVDAYNANPSSMKAALDNFAATGFDSKALILGDMLELGGSSAEEHSAVLEYAINIGGPLFLVGDAFSDAARRAGFPSVSSRCFSNVDALRNYFEGQPISGCTILVKGSHGIHLEKVIDLL